MIWNTYLVQWRTKPLIVKLVRIWKNHNIGIFDVDWITIGLPLSKTKEWEQQENTTTTNTEK